MAIIHPLQPRLSAAATKVVICVIWLLASLFSFPQGYYSTTAELPERVICFVDWPQNHTQVSALTWVGPCCCHCWRWKDSVVWFSSKNALMIPEEPGSRVSPPSGFLASLSSLWMLLPWVAWGLGCISFIAVDKGIVTLPSSNTIFGQENTPRQLNIYKTEELFNDRGFCLFFFSIDWLID